MAATYGFEFRFRECGKPPTVLDILSAISTAMSKGDMVEIGATTAGRVDTAIHSDTTIIGVVQESITAANMTAGTTRIRVIVDEDAVYGVTDANARLVGATLDISGATSVMTVGASSSATLVVVRESGATEETLVRIHPTHHIYHVAT